MSEKLVCRTCFKKIPTEISIKITPEGDDDESATTLELISFCIPEMDFFTVSDPVICPQCLKTMEEALIFRNKCLKNEERILTYLSKYAHVTKVNLLNLFQMKPSITINNNLQDSSKQEIDVEDVPTSTKPKVCYGCVSNSKDPTLHSKVTRGTAQCYICDKVLVDIQQLRKHVLQHQKKISCNICQKQCRDAHQLAVHSRKHSGDKPFTCPYKFCKKKFQQKYNLTQHLRKHTGDLKCNICDKVYSTKYNLNVHLKRHATSEYCKICNNMFSSKSLYNKHKRKCMKRYDSSTHIDSPSSVADMTENSMDTTDDKKLIEDEIKKIFKEEVIDETYDLPLENYNIEPNEMMILKTETEN